MKRTILAAALAVVALAATSSKSQAQIISSGFGSPYYGGAGYYPYSVYNNYGYNYGSGFSFSFGNAYQPLIYGNNYLPYQGRPYGTAYYGPRYNYGYSNFNSGYRGRGYRR